MQAKTVIERKDFMAFFFEWNIILISDDTKMKHELLL